MKKSLRPLVATAIAVGAAALSATSAFATAPTGEFAQFKYCPYQNAAATGCLVSTTTSGSFKLGNATVPINRPIVFQGGFKFDPNDFSTTFYDASNGGVTLSRTPLDVPGGLLGLMNPGGFFGLLEQAFENAVRSANGVTATAEQAGPIRFDYFNYLVNDGIALTLPVRVHLENPFLGPNCYIGSTSNPVTFRLTLGTTHPPAGTAPISGNGGAVTTTPDGYVATSTGNKLVDNTFSVPAASDCGYLPLDKLLITAAVNSREGLPSAAGRNVAILQGDSQVADAQPVRDSVH
jgi:hypothetical protein